MDPVAHALGQNDRMAVGDESVSVRVARPADVEGVLGVQRRSPGRSFTHEFREHIARAIEDSSLLFLVATNSAETVGWAMTKYFPDLDGEAPAGQYLMGVTITPAFRGRGVATKLVQARLDWIRQRDDRAYCFTNLSNTASIALHERVGFREVARAPQLRGVPFDGGTGILFSLDLN